MRFASLILVVTVACGSGGTSDFDAKKRADATSEVDAAPSELPAPGSDPAPSNPMLHLRLPLDYNDERSPNHAGATVYVRAFAQGNVVRAELSSPQSAAVQLFGSDAARKARQAIAPRVQTVVGGPAIGMVLSVAAEWEIPRDGNYYLEVTTLPFFNQGGVGMFDTDLTYSFFEVKLSCVTGDCPTDPADQRMLTDVTDYAAWIKNAKQVAPEHWGPSTTFSHQVNQPGFVAEVQPLVADVGTRLGRSLVISGVATGAIGESSAKRDAYAVWVHDANEPSKTFVVYGFFENGVLVDETVHSM